MHEHLNACQRLYVVGGRNACQRLCVVGGRAVIQCRRFSVLLPSREKRSLIVLICFFESEY